jgi:lambda family phage tail tape measure protein
MAKLQLKGSGLELSEREQFVQAEILRILGEQERKLAASRETMRDLTAAGVFKDAGTNSETAAVRDRLQAYIDSKNSTVSAARPVIARAAGDAFDGKKWEASTQRLSSSMEGSIKEGLTAGLSGDLTAMADFGKTLQKTVTGALVDAFYDAFLDKAVKGMANDLMNSIKNAIVPTTKTGASGAPASGGGGSGWGALWNVVTGFLGFADGGFTGAGGKYEPKGVVHGGEFVINKESTNKLGLGFLNSLNQYADGGFVPLTSGPSLTSNPAGRVSAASGPSIVFSPQTSIQVDSRSDRAAVIQDVQRVVAESQKHYTETLKRMKVLPS